METVAYDGMAMAGIVTWVQIIKKVVPESWLKLMPIFAAGAGAIYGLVTSGGTVIVENVIRGVFVGLAACGTFSGTKSIYEKMTEPPAVKT